MFAHSVGGRRDETEVEQHCRWIQGTTARLQTGSSLPRDLDTVRRQAPAELPRAIRHLEDRGLIGADVTGAGERHSEECRVAHVANDCYAQNRIADHLTGERRGGVGRRNRTESWTLELQQERAVVTRRAPEGQRQ